MKKKIISWIKKQVLESNSKGIVLGLSGGIDSCVTATLAKQAVGKKRALGLFMPCQSHPGDLKDAKVMAKKLGIRTKTIDLTPIYNSLMKLFPPAGSLAKNNLKPRLRMLTLYYFANKLNYLVSGTGNKSELMAGYFTKYGDGGCDILPIGDLFKAEVVKLAKEFGIPEHIITKPPSAGLWPGQTDEGEMGITYAELDQILWCMINKRKQVFTKQKVKKVYSLVNRSGHKRQGPKICYL
jgi:NAD+ synthase